MARILNLTYTRKQRHIRGDCVPQHRFLTRAEWAYLLHDGRISKFTYWTTFGPYKNGDDTTSFPHASSVTIFRKDYLGDSELLAAVRGGHQENFRLNPAADPTP